MALDRRVQARQGKGLSTAEAWRLRGLDQAPCQVFPRLRGTPKVLCGLAEISPTPRVNPAHLSEFARASTQRHKPS